MNIRLDGQVAIVTGAGQGLGRCHALALAERGAKVVVNDLGDENGQSAHADAVVAEIAAAGGEAMSHGANVANVEQVEDMVKQAMEKWGRVDILINNAGILRDKTWPCGKSCASRITAASFLRPRVQGFTATSASPTTALPRWQWSAS
jgi:NAD(P)-dependent dehydrogenase (short-subunit alcohol dehydrogenase family)